MRAIAGNIERLTLTNRFYRRIIKTIPGKQQLVLMNLEPGEDIPLETHRTASQFFRVEDGIGEWIVGNRRYRLKDGDFIIVPPNTKHYVRQVGSRPLKLYTIYSPPVHSPRTRNVRQPPSEH